MRFKENKNVLMRLQTKADAAFSRRRIRAHVRSWHFADMKTAFGEIRFGGLSGNWPIDPDL
jgi:hypothetical protein